MLDDNDRCAVVQQGLEHPQQYLHVQRVEADAGLIENEHRVGLGAADLAGQLEALGLAAGEAGRLFAQRQVAQTQLLQCLQALAHGLHPAAERKGGIDIHLHQLRQGDGLLRLVHQLHAVSRPRVAGTPAVGADDVHVRQELHVQAHLTGAVAAGAAQTARVVGKIAGLEALLPGVRRFGIELPQLVVDARVGRHGRAHIDADGRRVDELDVRDALGANLPDMCREGAAVYLCFQRRYEAFQHHRRFAGAGHARYHGEPPLGNVQLQRLDRVDAAGGEMDPSLCEHLPRPGTPAQLCLSFSGEERPDLGLRLCLQISYRPFGNDMSTLSSRFRPHLDHPVGLFQDLGVVVHQNDRVAIGHEVVHHTGQAHDVRRMQADGRLIQHIEHAGGAVADGPGQLHPLALTGGEGRGRAVKRQIAQT